MPSCTVRYHVRLLPKIANALAMDAVGIFIEERIPNEQGEPGALLSRHFENFSGPAGESLRETVMRGDAWQMDVQDRIGPLEWNGAEDVVAAPKERRRWLL